MDDNLDQTFEVGFSLLKPVQSRESVTDPLINDFSFQGTLARMVRRITPNATLRKDLFQAGDNPSMAH